MAKKFNIILNSCFDVFELQIFCNGNGSIQALVKEVTLPVEYADFVDVFSPMLIQELLPHAPHDYAIEIEDGQPSFGLIDSLLAVELNVLKKYFKDNLEKDFIRFAIMHELL
ncbi:hypothetical protein MMC22_008423, partial [Lobaria immixta]|nr:hypothetical protein [Lobaria immixta]